MKRIEHLREIGSREGPAPENLLGLLVDIYDFNMRVRMTETCRAVTKASIQRVELQPLRQFGQRSLLFLKKDQVIDTEREERDAQAEKERDAVPPPRLQEFVEAEEAPPLPKPCLRSCHRVRTLLAEDEIQLYAGNFDQIAVI